MSARTWEEAGRPADKPPEGRRRGMKVRRRSKPAEWAASFCRRIGTSRAEISRRLYALERYADRLPRRAGAAYGEITAKVARVHRELVFLAKASVGGLLTPSYREIGYKAKCCRGTVARALEVLERHGFIARQRRYRPARSGEPGRWEQDTNAYRLETPAAAERLAEAPHVGLDPAAVPQALSVRRRRPLPTPPPNLQAGAAILQLGEELRAPAALVHRALVAAGLAESTTPALSTIAPS